MLLSHTEPETLTIPVEPEKKNLSIIQNDLIDKQRISEIYGSYLSTSLKNGQEIILDFKNHPVLQGFIAAYRNDRPVTISPDVIWLLIIQAFSNHVTNNAEKLRSMFVNFDGKKELTVKKPDLNIFSMSSEDFEREIFPDFIKQIAEYTGQNLIDTMNPNFTTTTNVSLAVGQISIMSAMKNYFTYRILAGGCGYPYITIEGSIEDWTKIKLKLKEFERYDFEWFTSDISEIINKIIDTKKGNVDLEFWKTMIRYKDPEGAYQGDYADGWFLKFFPYDFYGHRISGPLPNGIKMPSEMLSVPCQLGVIFPGMKEEDVKCEKYEILAGFVGLTQNPKNASLKPEIGWVFRKQVEVEDKKSNDYQKEEAIMNSLNFRKKI